MEILNRLVVVVEFRGVPRRGRGVSLSETRSREQPHSQASLCYPSVTPPTQESRKREAYLDFGFSVAAFCCNFLPPVCYHNPLSAQNIT